MSDILCGPFSEVTCMIEQRHGLDIDPISFIVESTRDQCDSRYFFIKFDNDHASTVKLTVKVMKKINPRAM